MPNTRTRMRRIRSAFTLIEALIVVVVVTILATIAVQRLTPMTKRAKVAHVQSDFRLLATAIEAYAADYDQPPIAPVNYPWDSYDAGIYQRVTNGIALFTPLTTPVAYIASVNIVNPLGLFNFQTPGSIVLARSLFINFTTGVSAINSKTWCGQSMTLDQFYRNSGKYVVLNKVPVQYCFNGDTARKFPATWVLVSIGPSEEFGDISDAKKNEGVAPWQIWLGPSGAWEHYTVLGDVGFYDARNGTRSLGLIWRFSSGGMK